MKKKDKYCKLYAETIPPHPRYKLFVLMQVFYKSHRTKEEVEKLYELLGVITGR